jgi:hypothetical protein
MIDDKRVPVQSEPDEEVRKNSLWKTLSDAGLVEIPFEELPKRITEAKQAVMGRLSQLFQLKNDVQERKSVAHSLGTLKNLETNLGQDVTGKAGNKPGETGFA